MDVTPNAIVIVDGDLRIQDMSASAQRMFGHSRTSARGKPLQSVIPVIQDFIAVRDTGRSVQNKIVRMPRPAANGKGKADGELIVEKTIVPVAGPSGERNSHNLMLAIFRDVTDREQQRQELETLPRGDGAADAGSDRPADAGGARNRRFARRDDGGNQGCADAADEAARRERLALRPRGQRFVLR